jgi:hypothetical protein
LRDSEWVDHRPPTPASSAEPAWWLTDRIDLWGPDWVTNLVGWDWPAYSRLFHPLADQPGLSTWAATAQANGRVMHPSAQWDKICTPPSQAVKEGGRAGRGFPGEPMWGELNTWTLKALCSILARHSATPQNCYFALWEGSCNWRHGDGFGSSTVTSYYAPDGVLPPPPGPAPSEWQLDFSGPTFTVEGRNNYFLFEGHVGDAVRFGRWVHEDAFFAQSPNFMWPADHTWCVATEIDDDSTFIGGSAALIDELCASKVLEVLPIAPDASYEDHHNR